MIVDLLQTTCSVQNHLSVKKKEIKSVNCLCSILKNNYNLNKMNNESFEFSRELNLATNGKTQYHREQQDRLENTVY